MKTLLTGLFAIIFALTTLAGEGNQKIMIDVTSTDLKVYKSVLLTAKLMSAGNPETKLEIIVYGEALPMLLKNQSNVASEIARYIDNDNVIFTACELSMSLFNVGKDQLLEGVGTVGNAIEEIVEKQALGWGYIKSGN